MTEPWKPPQLSDPIPILDRARALHGYPTANSAHDEMLTETWLFRLRRDASGRDGAARLTISS